MDIIGYKYNTLQEAQIALNQVNTYYELPCGTDCLTWTEVQEGNGFWYLSSERLEEVLGEPVIIIIE